MYRTACYGLIGLGLLHLVVLGVDAANYADPILRGGLWTWAHWGPLANQDSELVASGFAFWSTSGSFAAPMIVLGGLLVSLDRRKAPVPRVVFFGLAAWLLVCSALMPPSGFPVALLVVSGLIFGRQRAATVGLAALRT